MNSQDLYTYKVAEVKRVIDGDSIEILMDLGFGLYSFQRIRMHGMDTPEIRTRDEEEKKFGRISHEYLQQVLANAFAADWEVLIRTFDDGRSKYGGYLGEIFVKGVSINERMIKMALAVPYHGENKATLQEKHLVNRKELAAYKHKDPMLRQLLLKYGVIAA